ncbi:MAG: hypothetical protein ACRCX2_10045 [Paraclostridium sp.]
MDNLNHKKALALILDYFKCYEFDIQFGEGDNGHFVMISKNLFEIGIALTTCTVRGRRLLKIEDIRLDNDIQRGGLGTYFIGIILNMANITNVTTGLWTEGETHLDKWYKNLGFKLIEINDITGHYWYEKKPNTKHERYMSIKVPTEAYNVYKRLKIVSKDKLKDLKGMG